MTLIRLVQTSILAGLTFASLSVYNNSAQADTPQFCVVANNGKTACGTLKAVERACVATDAGSVICGKYQSVRGEPAQGESRSAAPSAGYRKEAGGVTYLLRNCQQTSRIPNAQGGGIKCNFVLTAKRDNQDGFIYAGAGNSSFTDPAGNTYGSNVVRYSGETSTAFAVRMSAGIDYVVDLYFPAQQQITNLSLLTVRVADKVIQFRNIPISN
jgi:hypothetical protein